MNRRYLLLGLFGALAGCAISPKKVTVSPNPRRIQVEPLKLLATKNSIEVLDATGLFEAGAGLMDAKKYREALDHYDRLLAHFPKTSLKGPALYNAGLAHEALRQYNEAAKRYGLLIDHSASARNVIDASFRRGGCFAELKHWKASIAVFQGLLQRKDLTAGDRVEAYARIGLAFYHQHDYAATTRTLNTAIAFALKVQARERLDNDFFLAMSHFYLGAMPHARFRKATVLAGKQMGKQLDDKAKLLLLSQRRYIATIRLKNPYWATAAGFQIGSLYKEFYTTLMTALPDFKRIAQRNAKKAKIPVGDAERQLIAVYLQEVHKRVKPLLKKAIRVFEKNVVVGERVGINSPWVKKSRHQMHELKRLLLASPAEAIKMLPQPGQHPEDQQPAPDSAPAASKPTTRPTSAPKRAVM